MVQRLDAGAWFAQEFAGTRVPPWGAMAAARYAAWRSSRDQGAAAPGLMIRRWRAAPGLGRCRRVLVISFDHVSLALARGAPSIRTELITHARHVDPVAMARRAGAASVSIEWDMFHGEDASALHEAGIAVRVTVPGAKILAARNTYGFDDDARLAAHLAAGHIDVLAGDDASFVRKLVNSVLRF